MRCLLRSLGVLLSVLTIVDLTSPRALAAQTGEANVDGNANRPDRTSDSTPVAEAALEKALHRYQNVRDLEVDFEQLKTLKEMKHPLRAKGHLSVHPPDSVNYRITEPSPLNVTLTPQKIEIVSGTGADQEKQTLSTAELAGSKEQRQMQAMVAWLKLDPKQLASQYDVTALDRGASPREFKFAPKAAQEAPFTSLQLKLSAKDEVQTLVMNEISGDQIEFVFAAPKVTYNKTEPAKSKK